MESIAQPSRVDVWQRTNLDFDLGPTQIPKVRRAWERIPVKAAGSTQDKAKKVWKRSEPKDFQYETEHGGAGFAVSGAKRVRTQNMPALPVKKSVRRDRAEEAETQDELFARRRKSARLSSLNLQRLEPQTSPVKRRLEARRAIKTRDSLRSPLKDLRVMALTHNAQTRRARPSISNILQNGTPMRQIFLERPTSFSPDQKPTLGAVSTNGATAAMDLAFGDQENQIPLEQSNESKLQDASALSEHVSDVLQSTRLNTHVVTEEPSRSTPKRRSQRLSGQRASLEGVEAPEHPIPSNESEEQVRTEHGNPKVNIESAPAEKIAYPTSDDNLINEQITAEIRSDESAGSSPTHSQDVNVSETAAETVNFLSSSAPEDETCPEASAAAGSAAASPIKEQEAEPPIQENVLSVLQTVLEKDNADMDYDSAAGSDDELADNTLSQMYTFSANPEGDDTDANLWRSKAPRLSDDTSIIKDFLNRTQAKRTAQAQAAQLLTAKLAPSIQLSPRRSPRRPAASAPTLGSPLIKKSPQKRKIGTPAKTKIPTIQDGDESDELCSPTKGTRKSARRTPAPSRLGMPAPSMIPLRRPTGQEPVKLRKTETQELALATRTNTRRNKGLARMPREVLDDLSKKELSPVKGGQGRRPDSKAVDWQTELVSYLGPDKARAVKGEKVKRSRGLGSVNGTPAKAKVSRPVGNGPLPTASRKTRSNQV